MSITHNPLLLIIIVSEWDWCNFFTVPSSTVDMYILPFSHLEEHLANTPAPPYFCSTKVLSITVQRMLLMHMLWRRNQQLPGRVEAGSISFISSLLVPHFFFLSLSFAIVCFSSFCPSVLSSYFLASLSF